MIMYVWILTHVEDEEIYAQKAYGSKEKAYNALVAIVAEQLQYESTQTEWADKPYIDSVMAEIERKYAKNPDDIKVLSMYAEYTVKKVELE